MSSFLLFDALLRADSPGEAQASLAVCEPADAEVLPAFRAEASVHVALKALGEDDLPRAERELAAAEAEAKAAGGATEPRTQAALEAAKAALYLRQGRPTEAVASANVAAEAYRRLGDEASAAECVLLREEARGGSGLSDAVSELESALASVDEVRQPDLALRLLSSLAVAYGRAGRHEEAGEILDRMSRIPRSGPPGD